MPTNSSPQADKASCKINLGFPYHGQQTDSEVLSNIKQFLAQHQMEHLTLSTADWASMLEEKVSRLLGTEAAAWFPTGTLAQGIAAKIHTQGKGHNEVFLHPTSHLLLHEEDGYDIAYNLSAKVIGHWREPLSSKDLVGDARCAFVELPQRHSGGKLPDWETLQQLKLHCAEHDIALHLDGARLWSCSPYYQDRSYAEIISGFDSAYVSLYKDIGAIGGAVLVGKQSFIQQAKLWRTRLGGISVGAWPMIIDSLRLLDSRLPLMKRYVSKVQSMAAAISGLPDIQVDPKPPHSNLFHVHLPVPVKIAEQARDKLAVEKSIWLSDRFWGYESDHYCAMEIVVGDKALAISDQAFYEAMAALLDNLKKDF